VFDDHGIANSLTYGLALPAISALHYPKIPPVSPVRAIVSFDVNGAVALQPRIRSTSQQFTGSFPQTGATI
jgi:hypothetical protein